MGGGKKNQNFGRGYPSKKIRKKGGGVGMKKLGGGRGG